MVIGTKTRKVEPDITVVEITGRLNLGNNLVGLEVLLKRLIEDGSRKLVIDVAELSYVDSAAIGMLIATNGIMEQAGGRMRMSGAHGAPAKSFEVVHLDRLIPIDSDVESSCRQLTSGGAAA
jgi:anti-sigma B factor antagonist